MFFVQWNVVCYCMKVESLTSPRLTSFHTTRVVFHTSVALFLDALAKKSSLRVYLLGSYSIDKCLVIIPDAKKVVDGMIVHGDVMRIKNSD